MEQKANITINKEHITVERTQTAAGGDSSHLRVPRHGSETVEDKLKAWQNWTFSRESCVRKVDNSNRWGIVVSQCSERFDKEKEDCMNQSNQIRKPLFTAVSARRWERAIRTRSESKAILQKFAEDHHFPAPASMWMTVFREEPSKDRRSQLDLRHGKRRDRDHCDQGSQSPR